MALAFLLSACDSTGPEDWTYEGTIESSSHMVADVDQYAAITCEIAGSRAQTWTGDGAAGAHCLKHYHTVTEGSTVRPVHTLYVRNGPIGRQYRIRVE